jgi:hypothetical protein
MSVSLSEFGQALQEIGAEQARLRLDGDWLFGRFLARFPFLDPLSRRQDYLNALKHLESEAGWRLPKEARAWRQNARPALPMWVQQPPHRGREAEAGVKRDRYCAYSWTPPLQFVPNLTVMPDWDEALAIDRFFRTPGWDSCPWVPAKERSWELFGHGGEKRLESLARGPSWFQRGGLTLERLRCFRVPRLPVHADFDGPSLAGIMVSENEAGFNSFCRLARHGAGFRCVVLGDGNAVLRVTEFLVLRARELVVQEIWYLGDVDEDGLRIASSLAQRLAEEGLILRPWMPGYEVLLPLHRDPLSRVPSSHLETKDTHDGVGWLPDALRMAAREVLSSKGHKAQEQVGWRCLAELFKVDASARF